MLTVTELIYYCDLRCFDGGLIGAAHRDIEPVPEPVCKNLNIKNTDPPKKFGGSFSLYVVWDTAYVRIKIQKLKGDNYDLFRAIGVDV